MTSARRPRIHVALPGQFDNVGDTMHRRVLLDWLREVGELHLFTGQAPPSFVAGLRLEASDKIFTSGARWLRSVSWRDRPVVAFNPGEMSLGRRRASREAALYPVLHFVRSRKGALLRVGIAAGSSGKFDGAVSESVIRRSVGLSTHLAWREEASRDLFGRGGIVPDLAFALGNDEVSGGGRNQLAVTMRFDRPFPDASWLEAVRSVARQEGLEIVVTSQVRRDNERTVALGRALNARVDPWLHRDHAQQEDHVRHLYAVSQCVVSDRLHALIAGSTEGAVPVGLLTRASSKISNHFAAVGLEVGISTVGLTQNQVEAHLVESMGGTEGVRRQVNEARGMLGQYRRELVGSLVSS